MNGKQLKNSILQWAIQGKLVPPVCRQAGKTLMTNPEPRDKGKECWFTYVIECEDGSFYKGLTDNLLRRYQQHCNGTGADYTKTHKPKQLYYWEMHYSKEAALQREKYLKSGAGREWFKKEVVDKPENFEPASVLLKRIRKEKERLIKEKKIKRDKNASIIYRGDDNSYYEKILATGEVKCIDDEIPFEIPKGWEWCRLKHVCSMQAGKNITASKIFLDNSVFHPYRCVGGNGMRGYTEDFNTHGHYSIIGRQGALCGCVNIEKGKFYATEHAVVVDTYEILSPLFMYYFLTALNLNKYATATAQPGLAVSNVLEVMCPLPPLNEGERIIKKLSLLIPLIENYNVIQEKQNTLNDSIKKQLKRSVLQEAIQGKLVPQIAEEGTAQELLERIKAEKQKLVKEGKLKKSAVNDSVIFRSDDNKYWEKNGKSVSCIDDKIPFGIPSTWRWVRHNQLFEISGGSQPPKSQFIDNPKSGYVRLYQIRDYGSNPIPVYIPKEKANKMTKEGDIILARYGASLGKVFWAKDGAYNVAMAKAIPLFESALVNKQYLFLFYQSSIYQYLIKDHSRSAQAGFNKDDLTDLFFPLPPRKEQQRIVAKIEKLFEQLR